MMYADDTEVYRQSHQEMLSSSRGTQMHSLYGPTGGNCRLILTCVR